MEQFESLAKRSLAQLDDDYPDLKPFNDQVTILEGGQESSEEENFIEPVLERCFVCKEDAGKYKCPGCHQLYCKPACFTDHQKSKLCIRDKVPQAFKKLKDFSERDLIRDFNYISNMLEGYDKARKKLSQIDISLLKHQEMVRYKILAEHAANQGIKIVSAPRFMERHRENISFYFTKEKVIYWVFEVVLVMMDSQGCTDSSKKTKHFRSKRQVTNPICEDEHFEDVLKEFPFAENDVLVHFGENISLGQNIEAKGAKLFIKNTYSTEKSKADLELSPDIKDQLQEKPRFVQIQSSDQIKKVIRDLTLQEYPTLYLIKASDEINFCLHYN